MLQSRAWGEKYLSNPFPYLLNDISAINKEANY
jgi:hypothetical protein